MKKIIFSAILLMSCVAFVNAKSTTEIQTVSAQQEVVLTDLSEVIQEAVQRIAGETFEVMKVEIDAENELVKVFLVNKEDQSEKLVILDKDGNNVEADIIIEEETDSPSAE